MRRALTWALWSPRNAAVAAAALVCALALLGVTFARAGGSPAATRPAVDSTSSATGTPSNPIHTPSRTATPDAATRGPASPTPAPSTVQRTGENDDVADDPARVRAESRAATDRFVRAWLAGHGAPQDEWIATLKPLAAPLFLTYLQLTPTAAIPATTLTGVDTPDANDAYATTNARLKDGTRLKVELTHTAGRWLVANMEPAP